MEEHIPSEESKANEDPYLPNSSDALLIPPIAKPNFKRVKNKSYRQFLDTGVIETISEEVFINQILPNVKWRRETKQARCLVIAAFYTGARPIEYLDLKGKDVTLHGVMVTLQLRGAKRGLPRPIMINMKKHPAILEVYNYARKLLPEMFLFTHFRKEYVRTVVNKKGVVKKYVSTGDRLRFWFKIWFKSVGNGESVPPYFLRHNRFSRLIQKGASYEDIRVSKGSKSLNSVLPYVHMSTAQAEKISKLLD